MWPFSSTELVPSLCVTTRIVSSVLPPSATAQTVSDSLNGITAAFALQEQADPGLQARNLAYLGHALTAGGHPRLAALLSPQAQLPPPEELTDPYPDLIARVLTGLLGPA